MATTSLTFDLWAKDHASSTFNKFSHSVDSSNHSVGILRSGVGKLVGAFGALGVIYQTTQFLKGSIDQARESNKVTAQSMAVLKSTGYAANVYGDEIEGLANKISMKAGIDDEAIQSGENLLLTFRNVRNEAGKGNDIFARATRVTTDLSVAMGQSLKSSTIQVGKALNDPIKGLTALSRIGVTFGKGQVKRIKDFVAEGKSMSAQKVILRELNKEFKGSAAAQADPAMKAKVAWENLQETIGKKLLPILDKLLIWFVAKGLPAIEEFGGWLSDKLGPIISQVAGWFSDSSDKGGQLSSTFQNLVSAGKAVYDALYPIAVDIFEKIKENWPQIKATVSDVMNSVAATITAVAQLVTILWDKFGSTILQFTVDTFRNVSQAIQGALQIIQGIVDVFAGILTGDWGRVWSGLGEIVSGAWDIIKASIGQFFDTAKAIFHAGVSVLGDVFMRGLRAIVDFFLGVVGTVLHAADNMFSWVPGVGDVLDGAVQAFDSFRAQVDKQMGAVADDANRKGVATGTSYAAGLIAGLNTVYTGITTWAANAADAIDKAVRDAGQVHSPSRRMMEVGKLYGEGFMQGMIDQINSRIQSLKSAIGSVVSTVSGLFGNPLSGANVNTAADIFRQQHSELGDASRLRNDIQKLLHKGLDMKFIQQLVESGNLTALHALATDSRADVQRFERGQRRLERVTGRTSGILNQDNRSRMEDLKAERARDRALLDGLQKAVAKGMDGARIVIDARGHARLLIRQGGG